MLNVKGIKMFKVLDEVCTPRRETKYSAYIDLFARECVEIGAGETKIVPLGIKTDLDKLSKALFDVSYSYILRSHNKVLQKEFDMFLKSHYLEVVLNRSLAIKGLIIPNGIGIIDLDHFGEIGLIIHNPIKMGNIYRAILEIDDKRFKIKQGDKVAQCTLKEHKSYLMGYDNDVIRENEFGSTGK